MDAAKADLESVFQGLSMGSLNAFKLARAPEDAVKSLYGSAGEVVLYWAHHEKLCLIDRQLVFMGGLDMCKFDQIHMPTFILTISPLQVSVDGTPTVTPSPTRIPETSTPLSSPAKITTMPVYSILRELTTGTTTSVRKFLLVLF